jgi:hypothetical protein
MPAVFSHLSEYGHLAQLAIAIPIGSVENERTFSAMKYLMSPTRNKLSTNLNVVVRLFAQNILTLKTFGYERAFALWLGATERGRYGLIGTSEQGAAEKTASQPEIMEL